MRRLLFTLVLPVSLAAFGACGAQTSADKTEPVVVQPTPEPAKSGIEAITTEEIKTHVTKLASDQFMGRETNAQGGRMAAAYLAEHFRKLGLKTLPGHKGFLVDYTLHKMGFAADGTKLAVTNAGKLENLAVGRDFTPFNFSAEGNKEAEVVFAGYGITAPKHGHDDYKGLDVKDKIVLILRHTPNPDDKKSPLYRSRHGYFATKAMNAYQHGAAGMLLVTGPKSKGANDDLRLATWLRLPPKKVDANKPVASGQRGARRGARGMRGMRGRAGAPARRPFLAMHISKHSAESMLTSTGKTLAEIQNAIDKGTAASTFAIKDVKANVAVKKLSKPEPIAAQNVVGFLEGSDPQLKSEWVVVGAHYDHLGAFSGTGDTVYNGADDNASGTTGMLQLAKAFATLKQRPKRSMVFIGFSGEEKGLLGSRAMMRSGQLDSDKLVFMLNLDMIGRNADKPVAVLGNGFSTGITEAVEKSNQSAAVRIEFGGTDYSANSDHHPFFARGVPVLFFFTGTHTDYHQLGDHADKIAFARMTKIVRLAYGVLDQVASGTVTPNFIHHISWLGVAVQAKDLNGRAAAVVTSVEANSRGQRAGLAVGDIVRSIDGQVLTRPKKIGERFGALKPGKKAVVVLERAGSPVNVTVERAKRGYLGVMPSSLRAEERKKLGLLNNEGVKIRGTSPDGPAGKAGLKAGDVLIRINGHPLTWRTLGRHLARIGAGERVTLTVVRAGKRLKIPLTLAERPRRP